MLARVNVIAKPNSSKNAVMNRTLTVSLGSSNYNLTVVSTNDPSVVISWLRNHVSGSLGYNPVCVMHSHEDLVLGFMKNKQEILLYQLNQPHRIHESHVDFFKDEIGLRFLGFKLHNNLIEGLKGSGFELKILKADEANVGKLFKDKFIALQSYIAGRRSFEEYVDGTIMQEESIVLSSLHLLLTSFM